MDCFVPWAPAEWALLLEVGTSGGPNPLVPNGQASLPAQSPISLGWVVMRCCKAFRGPPSGGRGAARAQRYRLCALCPPPPPQMMGSSHLKNSRITLLMGFSALGSCESCSVVLTGIALSEYGGWGAHAACRCEPRLSLPHCVPCLLGFLMEDGGEGTGKGVPGLSASFTRLPTPSLAPALPITLLPAGTPK